jgi:UPF0716 protein FxsA
MHPRPLLYGLVDPDTVLRAMFVGLLTALLLLADGYVLIILSRQVGIYLLLATVASTGLLALIAIMAAYRHELDAMHEAVAGGAYPRRQFRRLIPLLTACALLIAPGFVSDAAGVLLLIRPVGWLLGALVEHRHEERFRRLYEHLRIQH